MKALFLTVSLFSIAGLSFSLQAASDDDPIVVSCPPPTQDFGKCHVCMELLPDERYCVYTGSVQDFCDMGCGWWN